jgi:hypothetical protein
MYKNIFLLLSLFIINHVTLYAQQDEDEVRTVSVTKITVLEPGIAYELPVGGKSSLFFRTGLTATLATDYYDEITGVLFRVFGAASGRVYYNFEKRNLQERNIKNNSANYFALLVLVATQPLNKGNDYDTDLNKSILNTGIVWGMQRNYPSRFSLDLNLGLGYVKAGNISSFSPVGEFNIGFRLGKK